MTQRELYILKFMANAVATYDKDTRYWYYTDNNEDTTLCLYYGDSNLLEIPNKIDGNDITVIGASCFNANSEIKSIKISDGIEVIE